MNPRIIQGKFKGRRLAVAADVTRPYTDRVKKTLFDILRLEIKDKLILDIFAGSGGIGLEALSIDAKEVTFVDANQEAINAIKSNIKMLDVFSECKVIKSDYIKFLKTTSETYDIIFCDPPFRIAKNIKFNLFTNVMSKDSLLIFRSDVDVTSLLVDFQIIDYRKIGVNHLYFLRINPQ